MHAHPTHTGEPFEVFLSLGSNLGDRLHTLQRATQELCTTLQATHVRASSIYETQPRIDLDQPLFLNAVLALHTPLATSPEQLLNRTQQVESNLGRVRDPNRPKGPRHVDIDLLYIGDLTHQSDTLTIPHPALHQRRFVLVPLAELAPHTQHPVLQHSTRALLHMCLDDGDLTRLPNLSLLPTEQL